MNPENKNYQLSERGEKAKQIAVTFIGGTALAIMVSHGPEMASAAKETVSGPEVRYTGTQNKIAEHGTNPTKMVREHVEYDKNEVSTPEIVNYVVDLPENQEVMEDGLGAGEPLMMPEKAERQD